MLIRCCRHIVITNIIRCIHRRNGFPPWPPAQYSTIESNCPSVAKRTLNKGAQQRQIFFVSLHKQSKIFNGVGLFVYSMNVEFSLSVQHFLAGNTCLYSREFLPHRHLLVLASSLTRFKVSLFVGMKGFLVVLCFFELA